MVFQHFSLFETLTVAENIALTLPRGSDLAALDREITAVSTRYGLLVDPRQLVHALSVGERQRVEIVRCLMQKPKLLILDEPTSVLTPQAVRKLFETLRALAAEGCSILYISHKLDEIQALCHVATVLRAGRVTATCIPSEETPQSMARMMIGTELPVPRHRRRSDDGRSPAAARGPLARVRRPLRCRSQGHPPRCPRRGDRRHRRHLGQRTERAPVGDIGRGASRRKISGPDPRHRGGSHARGAQAIAWPGIRSGGAPRTRRPGAHDARGERSAHRASARHGALGRHRLPRLPPTTRTSASSASASCAAGRKRGADSLSGGNLQKFIVGREVLLQPEVLVVAQPTWGVDVGASAFIRQALLDLSSAGAAILVISEELDELFEICDRIAVIANGKLSPARRTSETSTEEIGVWMSGLWPDRGPGAGNPRCGLGSRRGASLRARCVSRRRSLPRCSRSSRGSPSSRRSARIHSKESASFS